MKHEEKTRQVIYCGICNQHTSVDLTKQADGRIPGSGNETNETVRHNSFPALLAASILLLIISGISPFAPFAAASTVEFLYDDAGRLIQADYGNGMIIDYTYDPNGNLLTREISYLTPSPTLTPSPSPTETPTPTSTPTGGAVRRVPDDYSTISEAINACVSGDTILIAPGTYIGADNKNLDFLGKAITVSGEGDRNDTVIDCMGEGRGFHLHSGEGNDAVIMSLTIRNASVPYEHGAGIYCDGTAPSIIDCVLENPMEINSQCSYGGGIMCRQNSPIISDCRFYKNDAGIGGGGIACTDGSDAQISGCEFIENIGFSVFIDGGGGIFIHAGSHPTVTDCLFDGNVGRTGAGLLTQNSSNPNISNCRFINNHAYGPGGGISCEFGSNPTITNCLFSYNTSNSQGGALCSYNNSQPLFRRCTIDNNMARGEGGAMMNKADAIATLEYCIFRDNKTAVETGLSGCGAICNTAVINIYNCWFEGNQGLCNPEYDPSGGALCLWGDSVVSNCMIVDNYTQRNGGAIYASVFSGGADIEISNCTIADNETAPEGHGQGLYCDSGAEVNIINSILWDADVQDDEIYIEDGTVTISYSDVRFGWTGPGSDNISQNPQFASGPYGSYHLDYSSPCLNIGSDLAENIYINLSSGPLCMNEMSVAPDLSYDAETVDLGYHTEMVTPTPTFSPTAGPTDTPFIPTETPSLPTETPTQPTETPTLPTETPTLPTETPVEPTETETPTMPTDTPTRTPTGTLPTGTPTLPTETPTMPTHTPTALTETPVIPTNTPTNTPTVPTETPTLFPTGTPILPTETPVSPTETPTTPTSTPTRTPTEVPPTVTFTTTAVPTQIVPTPLPSPSPTFPCDQTGVTLEMPSDYFIEGDPCYLWAWLCNRTEEVISGLPMFIVLDVYDEYWFAPTWTYYEDGIDYYSLEIQPGLEKLIVIDEFLWPPDTGQANGIKFYGAFTDPNVTQLIGNLGNWTFSWGD